MFVRQMAGKMKEGKILVSPRAEKMSVRQVAGRIFRQF